MEEVLEALCASEGVRAGVGAGGREGFDGRLWCCRFFAVELRGLGVFGKLGVCCVGCHCIGGLDAGLVRRSLYGKVFEPCLVCTTQVLWFLLIEQHAHLW